MCIRDSIVPDCWIYVQDTNVKLGRIQIFNNLSPYMVKAVSYTHLDVYKRQRQLSGSHHPGGYN